jgi:hypothetical protein
MLNIIKDSLNFNDQKYESLYKKVNNNYINLLQNKFQLLMENSKGANKENFKKLTKQISTKKLLKILEYPTVSNVILNSQSSQLNVEEVEFILIKALMAEVVGIYSKFEINKYSNYIWTADGSLLTYFVDNEFRQYNAPKVGNSIPVDNFSPNYHEFKAIAINEYNDKFEDYNMEEFYEGINRLEFNFEKLSQISKKFVSRFIKVLMLKQLNGDSKKSVLSCSDGAYIGRVAFVNIHIMKDWHLIEALIHEAIHGYIHQLNLTSKFATFHVTHDTNFTSPWTGNNLTLHNLFEAVHVWYAIFINYKNNGHHFSKEVLQERMQKLQTGFKKLNLEDVRIKKNVSSIYLDYLKAFKEEIVNYGVLVPN